MRFVAPRNFKQGRLIMNQYRVSDLILLAVCTAFSFIFTIIYLTNVDRRFFMMRKACNDCICFNDAMWNLS